MNNARFNPDGLVLSDRYADTMNGDVLPWLAARRVDSTVAGEGGRPLFCSRFDAEGPRGTVLIVHGFTENATSTSSRSIPCCAAATASWPTTSGATGAPGGTRTSRTFP